jgi:hypothetical protein
MALATTTASASSPICSATGYERQTLSLFGALDEGGASCDCDCSEPSNMNCPSTVDIRRKAANQPPYTCAFPTVAAPYLSVASGSCTPTLLDGYSYGVFARDFTSGSCTPQPTTDIEPARWTRRIIACETNDREPAGCDSGEHCVPELVTPLETWCVYRAGIHDCPTGAYSQQTIYYEDFDDGRSCSACTCGTPTGSCEGYVDFMTGTGCGTARVERVELGACFELNNGPAGVKATPGPVIAAGECPRSGGELQGSVTLQGGVTVCCMP